MNQETALSGEEIAALMGGFREQPDGAAGAAAVVRPFSFGKAATGSMSALPALDRMNERIARSMRELLEPFARTKLRVTAQPVALRSYEEWQAEQPDFTSLSLYAFKPLKGGVLLVIEPAFISRLVDSFYGGSGVSGLTRPKEFTGAEENFLTRLAEQLIGAVAGGWSEIAAVKPQLRSRETNVAFATLARPDEAVAVSRFEIQAGSDDPSVVEIVYPGAALRSVEAELAAKSIEDVGVRGEEWRERLGSALGGVRVKARTVLARPELTLSELMKLQAGDVIPVSLPLQVPLLVEGRPIAHGTIGEHDGRAALKIEKIEQGKVLR